MLQQALAGGADIAARAITGECKAWLLRGRRAGDLRLVVVNKDGAGRECAVDLRLAPEQMRRYAATGAAHYLYASGGLDDRWRIYYSGQFFDEWGADKQWREQLVPVARYTNNNGGGGGFLVHLTNGTLAALVKIPLAAAVPYKAPPPVPEPAELVTAAAGGGGGGGMPPLAASAAAPAAKQASAASKAPAAAAEKRPAGGGAAPRAAAAPVSSKSKAPPPARRP